jgi:hypothetical protein
MKEGTRSVLFGCHNPLFHGLCVLAAWRITYKSWPKWWQIICIFVHDVGVWGRQYLSDDTAKKGHWELGARWSMLIVHRLSTMRRKHYLMHRAWQLCAGHAPNESGYVRSELWLPDKKSWLIAPMVWLWWNYYVEWHGKGIGVTRPPEWRKMVAENLRVKNPIGNHELYIKHRKRA